MKLSLILLIVLGLFPWLTAAAAAQAARRPITIDDLFRFKRSVADPQISPDGKLVVYVVISADLAGNKTASALWLAPVAVGGEPRQLTNPGEGKKDKHPRWSPDGQQLLFESNRSGDNQLWLIDLAGGEARQLTTIATEATNGLWSFDRRRIAFVSTVWPEYSDKPYAESNELNKKRKEEIEKSPVKAKVFTKLFYRHWDSYVEDKRQHLFVLDAPYGSQPAGQPWDVTPGDRDSNPTSSTFSVGDDFTFSPDSQYLIFTAVPERDEAWSTNHDLCRVPVGGGKTETLTADNKAADGAPRFSPDGKKLAYRAHKRAGCEADKWEIMVVETDIGGAFRGKPRSVTADFDAAAEAFVWSGDGQRIYFPAHQKGTAPIFEVSLSDGKPKLFIEGHVNGSLSYGSGPQDTLLFTRAALSQPPEVFIYSWQSNTKLAPSRLIQNVNLSRANTALLAELDLPRPESVEVPVEGAQMQMWILKPPGFDPKKKYPVAFLVHGGPQGAWEDSWSFRWVPELWAAQGYVVALPNPRGSTGFGQKFVDEISGDWGGKCYDDLMKGADYVEKLPYVDKDRIAAAGASFGGYMVNWFAVNTGRFKCLISHCGVWNFESMYATTEELWFDEWEHGGPPWGPNRKSYDKHSPHRLAGNLAKFKTPMLLIQNDLDFRCPVGEGHQLFTTLQRQGVPSRFINFPDEGHWVSKPKNSEYWHKEVFAWLTRHCPPGGR